jgi:glycosyltransferase involved in cell wall biosynthesis
MPYSTLVLTFNEAENIRRCLDSLGGCDDVVVLDSYSTDGTVDLLRDSQVRVFQRCFDTFAGQRNWAIDNVPFKHPWVLHLDADECMTPQLHEEIETVTARDEKSAYLLANKLIFMNRWIKRASMYPFFQARLLRRGESRFAQRGHGQILDYATRGVGKLREPYLHYNFSRGIEDWVTRHNKYSSDEAARIAGGSKSFRGHLAPCAIGDRTEDRQQRLKSLAARLPCRPLMRFLYLYFYKAAFLDGRAGFDYSVLMGFYDYLTRLKVRELKKRSDI